jgi:peptidoglycan/xylan/chitin deacetylase (PgdA/CDA1 family)
MKFYWIKTHFLIKKLFSKYIWSIPNRNKIVYLTFDDGPTPIITDFVLSELNKFNAKATFFCIGKNIQKYPNLLDKILADEHQIGNHTFNHLNGWQVDKEDYLENTFQCENEIRKLSQNQNKLFRPPYGKIKTSQAKKLIQKGYKIIMWDVLSADFDASILREKCLKNVIDNVQSGSIIVFHDSVKAFSNLEYTLPKTLAILKDRGFTFESIKFE